MEVKPIFKIKTDENNPKYKSIEVSFANEKGRTKYYEITDEILEVIINYMMIGTRYGSENVLNLNNDFFHISLHPLDENEVIEYMKSLND